MKAFVAEVASNSGPRGRVAQTVARIQGSNRCPSNSRRHYAPTPWSDAHIPAVGHLVASTLFGGQLPELLSWSIGGLNLDSPHTEREECSTCSGACY